jgi:hypothetical protein
MFMKLFLTINIAVLLSAAMSSQGASADTAVKPIAVGLAPSAYNLDNGRWGVAPEIIAYGYLPIDGAIFARVGARFGSRGWISRDMPTELNIREREVSLVGDIGVLYQSAVVPSLSMHAGSEWLPMISVQVGLGLPLTRRLLVEPFMRFEKVISDNRLGLRWGIEATISL